jgi:hypothetical protein
MQHYEKNSILINKVPKLSITSLDFKNRHKLSSSDASTVIHEPATFTENLLFNVRTWDKPRTGSDINRNQKT